MLEIIKNKTLEITKKKILETIIEIIKKNLILEINLAETNKLVNKKKEIIKYFLLFLLLDVFQIRLLVFRLINVYKSE